MDYWPKDNHHILDLIHTAYIVDVKWSKKPYNDYSHLSKCYYECGYIIFKDISENLNNHIKTDSWFFPAVFLMRQSIELGLKALICKIYKNKCDIQNTFEECRHSLSDLYSRYSANGESLLSVEENEWLVRYITSLENVDSKSDMFRFPFDDAFLCQYRDKFIDIIDVANNMFRAYSLIKKCIGDENKDANDVIDISTSPEFLIFASHGMGNCYLWQDISDAGFHNKVQGYVDTAALIYDKCDTTTLQTYFYPLMFLLRNAIELCLKRLFFSEVDNGVPKHIFMSKRKSHLLKKDLWKYVRPVIKEYAKGSDLSLLDVVESQIIELDTLDKNSDIFRYPTTYSLEYKIQDRKFDIKNVYEFMRGLIDFFESCDTMLSAIADYESEMKYYYQ